LKKDYFEGAQTAIFVLVQSNKWLKINLTKKIYNFQGKDKILISDEDDRELPRSGKLECS
jgi:hypothetical protein